MSRVKGEVKKIITVGLIFSLVLTLVTVDHFQKTQPAYADLSTWYKAVTIQPFSADDFASDNYKRLIDHISTIGANYVTLIVPYYQHTRQTTDMYPGWNTSTDQALTAAITYAHAKNLKVILKPHLETDYIEWRGNIDPPAADRQAWFNSYGTMLSHYGTLAQNLGVEDFIIGTELIHMASPDYNQTNTAHWRDLIKNLRQIYKGKIGYSANWQGELDRDQFFGDLDYIGISAYYDLYHAKNDSVSEQIKSWDQWRTGVIEPVAQKFNKPIVFTEIGFRSIDGAYRNPWDWARQGPYNPQSQANSYEALFEYWKDVSWMKGLSIWRYDIDPSSGGRENTDYTPQGKPAELTLQKWFSFNQTPSQTLSQTLSNVAATPIASLKSVNNPAHLSITVTPLFAEDVKAGTSAHIDIKVHNDGADLKDKTVQLELHGHDDAVIWNKTFPAVTIQSGADKIFSIDGYTFPADGRYFIKFGIFEPNWGVVDYWNNSVADFLVPFISTPSVQQTPIPIPAQTPPPVTPQPPSNQNLVSIKNSDMDIWWPTDKAVLSGLTPFKVMIKNANIDQYSMFWQVDGDRLNGMENSQIDYPHKEALVDLSGWKWKGAGPYSISFIAQDLKGKNIARRVVQIYKK